MLLFNKPTAISYISKSGDKVYPVVIDIKEGVKSSETLSFMTADSNTGILSVAFMEGETIYNIDDATVVCDIERPDGTDLSIGAVKVADGVVEVPLGVNGTSQPGMYMFDFKIVRPGSKTIGVPLVSYTVTQSINADEIVAQDDRLPVLNDLIVKIQNATSASTQATNECKTVTNNANNTLKSINNAIASGTVDLELKQLRTSLNGTLHPTANDRINQMETHLLEATATTIETESNFTTVDATNNGYFEDVKLEGKTLVNLCKGNVAIHSANNRLTQDISRVVNDFTLINTSNKAIATVIYKNEAFNRSIFFNSNTVTHVKLSSDERIGGVSYLYERGWTSESIDYAKINTIILEGDYTNNPPEYFEGLMSVGQDVEEVSVESRNSDETQSNKKPLLYYNPTTETWEKPILREWDTIEKHSDGKYYYHKRSGEVVLNGSENWTKSSSDYDSELNITFTLKYRTTSSWIDTSLLICSRLHSVGGSNGVWNGIKEGIATDSNHVLICINKSRLSTQDVEGFKAWLKANPITLVYQLVQEEVYECTNIDLMTYSGETNYIINSGAITPKSLLKVHNNIANVVKILQEKVNLLENTFIAGLKSVLSGDMYSLATILYPEDFEQNDNIEQDIMVIPE